MNKLFTIFTIFLTVALLCSCNQKTQFDASGTFEATEITISGENSGRILSFDSCEGSEVIAGLPVLIIDSIQLHLSKLQLQKNVKSVTSNRPDIATQIAALEEQKEKYNKEKLRTENLLKSNAATEKQLDDIISAIAVLDKQIEAQKSSLKKSISSIDAHSSSIEIQIAQIEDLLSKCKVKSPINGILLTKYAEAGEFAVTGKPLFKVADIKHLFLRAYITSKQLSSIKLGQKVKVFADFGADNTREYEGTISWISSESEFTPKGIQTSDDRANLVYAIKIAVENDGYIKIGMYGEVSF